MKIVRYEDIEPVAVDTPGAKGASVRIPIGIADGAPNFTMRVFTMAPGGNTPFHRHDYEHEVLIVKGRGELRLPDRAVQVEPGTAILVPADQWHGFKADAEQGLEMVCLVPNRAYTGPIKVEAGPSSRMDD